MKGSQGKKKRSKQAFMMKVVSRKAKLHQKEELRRLDKLEKRQKERERVRNQVHYSKKRGA